MARPAADIGEAHTVEKQHDAERQIQTEERPMCPEESHIYSDTEEDMLTGDFLRLSEFLST